jgi:HipA-like protein
MNPLIVHLHGKRVGLLTDDGQRLVFRYDEAWLEDAGALPLSRQLPLQAELFEGQRVNVFFGGLLPEAGSRDQIARNLGKWGQCANLDKMPPDLRFNSLPEDRRSAPSNIPLRAVTFMPFGKSSCVKR